MCVCVCVCVRFQSVAQHCRLGLCRFSVNRSARALTLSWSKSVEEGIGFEAGVLVATAHPIVPGGALILVGTSGGTLGVWEAGGKLQPHHVGTQHLPGEPEVRCCQFLLAGLLRASA